MHLGVYVTVTKYLMCLFEIHLPIMLLEKA